MSRKSRRSRTQDTPADFTAGQVATMLSEVGATLSHTWDQLSPGEYNAALLGNQAQLLYDKMRRSDGQVGALEAIISLPVRAVTWWVEPAGSGKADQEAAALIEATLFEGMTVTWDDLLSEMLLAALCGFAVHEKVLVEENGYVRWHKFAHRGQTTILEFTPSNAHPEPGVVQGGTDASGRYQELFIPRDKLLITEYCRRLGLLRRSYKHWFMADSTYRITNLGIENNLVGTIMASVTGGLSDAQHKKLLKAIEDVRARNITGLIKPAGVELELLEASRSTIDALPYIEHHRTQIIVPALAQFLLLGHTNRGTQGLAENHSNIFMVAEHALAKLIADNLNRHAIPQLCALNWPGLKVYPKVSHEHPSTVVSLDAVSYAIGQLVSSTLLTPDADLENRVRAWYGLPELQAPREAAKPGAEVDETAGDQSDEDGAKPKKAKASMPRLSLGPELQPAHAGCDDHAAFAAPELSAVGALFDQTADAFQTKARALLDEMIAHLERTARPALARLDPAHPMARARLYPVLAKLTLPGRARYTAALREYLTTLVEEGRKAAAAVQDKPVEPLSREETTFVGAQAELLTERHLSELKSLFCQQLLDGAIMQVGVRQAVADAAQASRDRLNTDFQGWFRDALLALANHVGEGLATG
jgi:hypothetical protein